jgi:hypothetical protein
MITTTTTETTHSELPVKNKQRPGLGSPGLSQGNGSSSTNGSKLDDKLIGIGH